MRLFASWEEGIAIVATLLCLCCYAFFAVNTRMWVARTDKMTIRNSWNQGHLTLNGDELLFSAARSNRSSLPTAVEAVIVPAAFLAPDHVNVSRMYEDRLISGYHYALMSGAPLLILSGSSDACELARHFLLSSPAVLELLFPARLFSSLTGAANATAQALKRALGAQTGSADKTEGSSRRITLGSLLRATPLHPDYRRFISSHTSSGMASDVLDGTIARRARADHITTVLAALAVDAEAEAARGHHEDRSALYAHHGTATGSERVVAYGGTDESGDVPFTSAWSLWSPRDILAFPHSLHHGGRHYVLPGILLVDTEVPDESEDAVAQALYKWVQQTAVSLALRGAGAPSHGEDSGEGRSLQSRAAMRWLNQSRHAVVVVSSSNDQQYVKLIHRQALHKAEDELAAQFDRATREVVKRRLAPLRGAPELPRAPARPLSVRFTTFITTPLSERLDSRDITPLLLPYTGLLPESAPANACGLAKWLGRFSHYIYDNHRRISDAVMNRIASAAQVDEFQVFLRLLRKVDRSQLSFTDLIG